MDWSFLSTEVEKGWPVIQQAPLTFSVTVFLTTTVSSYFVYRLFAESLKRKNDLISDLKCRLDYCASTPANLSGPKDLGNPQRTVGKPQSQSSLKVPAIMEQEPSENNLPDGYISLHEAVEKLHQAAKQGKIPMMGAETISGGTWDNPGPGSEEQIYTWWAIRIANDDEIEMRGRRLPGDIEKIPKFIKKDFLFVDKATRLKDPMHDEVYYTDLCVNQDALEASYYLSYGFHQG